MFRRHALAAVAVLGLCACSPAVTEVGLDGTLSVLAPRHDFSTQQLADDWLVVGKLKGNHPKLGSDANQLYLELLSTRQRYALIKRVRARMLATPFLAWNWRLIGPGAAAHPMQLIVGFADRKPARAGASLRTLMGDGLPAFSRTLAVTWGASALRRGFLEVRSQGRDGQPAAVYVVRGGRENLGRWWRETLDLSALYAKAWPDLDRTQTQIVFVGVVVRGARQAAAAHLSSLRLSR